MEALKIPTADFQRICLPALADSERKKTSQKERTRHVAVSRANTVDN